MVEIIPAIMPHNFQDLEDHARRVCALVPLVQIDVMDGKFVHDASWPYFEGDDKTFSALVKNEQRLPFYDELSYEVDLMVDEPEQVVEDWMSAGVRRIIIHIESTTNMSTIIRDVKIRTTSTASKHIGQVSLGVALNSTTDIAEIEPFIDDIDFVQCMGIAEIGKQGEPFDERVYDQLRKLRKARPALVLSVDGGVHLENARELVVAGANRLVSGSEIFESAKPSETINAFYAKVSSV